MDKIQALTQFWAGFGLPAYDATSVPSDAAFPYITFEVAEGEFGDEIPLTAGVWYKGTQWVGATQKAAEIGEKIGRGGIVVPYEGGAFWLRKSSPFSQRMADDNDLIRHIVLQVGIEYID